MPKSNLVQSPFDIVSVCIGTSPRFFFQSYKKWSILDIGHGKFGKEKNLTMEKGK